jgi:hypothetical protein
MSYRLLSIKFPDFLRHLSVHCWFPEQRATNTQPSIMQIHFNKPHLFSLTQHRFILIQIVTFTCVLHVLRHQGPGTYAPDAPQHLGLLCDPYNSSPPPVLDVPTFAARCLHVHTTREIEAARGWTYGREYYMIILPKCRLPHYT